MGGGRDWVGKAGMAGKESAGGECFPVPASENEFSKYSGIVVLAGRNRPRFAIQAHCGLLVTSMKDRCMSFDNHIRLSAPSEAFKENIKIVETEEDTIITIKGKYINEK